MARTVLHVHHAGNGYVGQLHISETAPKSEKMRPPQRVIIMDNSGSMGQWSRRMANGVFPEMLRLLGAAPDEPLLLILFSCAASHHHMKVADLNSFVLPPQGSTNMQGVFQKLQTELDESNPCVQLLALSDGDVSDQVLTANAAAAAAAMLKARFQIEARAVRLFTSASGQPDTRALASVLQLNTDSVATLVDMRPDTSAWNDAVAQSHAASMASMFGQSGTPHYLLQAKRPILQLLPWAEPKNEALLRCGKNTLWLTHVVDEMSLNDVPVEIVEEEPLSRSTLSTILEDRLEFFVSHLKVLKVIDTEQAKVQIAQIMDYFRGLEATLRPDEDLAPLLEGGGLKGRAIFIKRNLQRSLRSVTTMLENIANDDRVKALNQLQQAEYLRQMDTSKNAKALAKRAQTSGTDFEATMRKEIRQMKDHLHELSEVDAKLQSISFYSQASTLDGIMEVCDLADDPEVFEALPAVDLLRLFNVVGVPALGPIADYPDPMTYRLDRLMPGSFVSVADLSMVELAGKKLQTPGTKVEIANAIPFFDDPRVQGFLQRHASSCMEYICSIGMRRVLAEVPQTFTYSLCAGLWRLIQQLDADKSELNVTTLCRMAPAYHQSLQGRFDYLVPTLKTPQSPEKSFFLSHNGITNLISPLWRIVQDGALQNVPRILRALYTFESFQVMRRLCRQKEAKYNQQQLDSLLGVDFERHGTPLPQMFSRPEALHCQTAEVNQDMLRELCKPLNYVRYATLIVPLFEAVHSQDPVERVRAVPQISDEKLAEALGLDYPLDEFLLYNIVEGFLHQTKQSRVDQENTASLRPDLGERRAGEQLVKEYLWERYNSDYELRLKVMATQERDVLCDDLIKMLLETDALEAFCKLLSEGLTRGVVTFQIVNVSSQGCLKLHESLLDKSLEVPKRAQKLQVFYTGEDTEEKPVWNGGNMFKTVMEPLRQLLADIGEESTFERIQERGKVKRSHVYRGGKCNCNRKGHSNDLPSFFAFGHDLLASYHQAVTAEAWADYQKDHAMCCGMPEAVRDPESLTSLMQHLAAKRERRAACLSDPLKMNAAIDAKKARRAEGRRRPQFHAPVRGAPQATAGHTDSDEDSRSSRS